MEHESKFRGYVAMAPYLAVMVPFYPSLCLGQLTARQHGGQALEQKYCDVVDKFHEQTGERLYAFGSKHGHVMNDAIVHLVAVAIASRIPVIGPLLTPKH